MKKVIRIHGQEMEVNSVSMKSEGCFLCGSYRNLETHHVFGGIADRPISDKLGLTVRLCPNCHREGKLAVHKNREQSDKLKALAQGKFEEVNTHEEFIELFGKNYLEEFDNDVK